MEQLSSLLSKWQGFSASPAKTGSVCVGGGGVFDIVMGVISTIKSKREPWEYGNECQFQCRKLLLEEHFYDMFQQTC